MAKLGNGRGDLSNNRKGFFAVVTVLLLLAVPVLLCSCQQSGPAPSASAPSKAAAPGPSKDASSPESNELNYDKAMAKQYAEGTVVVVTGKVTQIPDEKSILMATRKDDVFGYLDNMVTVTFSEKPTALVGDIIRVKSKTAGLKKYKTEGKGEYDAPFLKGEAIEILEKGKPTK